MGKNERYAYLKEIRSRYLRVGRKAKGRILNEFCAVCGYHRKYAIRLLNRPVKRPRHRIGRRQVYGSKELLAALKRIWFASDQMCSKKLVAVLPLWLPFYADAYGALRPEIEQQLRTLSAATIDRLLKPIGFYPVSRSRSAPITGTSASPVSSRPIPWLTVATACPAISSGR